jgi:SPP1 gp7 family putative phage head morphogenesis protein
MAKVPEQFTNKGLFKEILKMKREKMSPGNRARTNNPKVTKKNIFPRAAERNYANNIRKIMKQITSLMVGRIEDNLPRWIREFKEDSDFRKDALSDELQFTGEEVRDLIKQLMDENPDTRLMITNAGFDVSDKGKGTWEAITKGLLGIEFIATEPWETAAIEAWSQTNFELIKSLPGEYIKKVNTVVSEGVLQGKTSKGILDEVKKITKNFNKARPELIARDQVGKLNSFFTQKRQAEAGIDMYIWSTAADERVRGRPSGKYPDAIPSHWEMEGKLCRWDDASVYSEDGGKTWKKRTGKMPKVHPGIAINCRCSALPYFADIVKEMDEIIRKEKEAA